MNGIRHPYSKDLYEQDEDGTRVRITRADGTVGYYSSAGRWLEGVRFDADLHLCGWIMAPRNVHRLATNPASH
ncbi:hypothetical protein QWI29_22085 [Mycolicibacterium neoaurum]|uniref:hypothetical protein n=1 Tax=Mycolicibacterium neoaurum TaxID=1795 RepID=UPI002672C054|nr:hypothetical protein [Mycolicibacterium neoaurum]MDO3402739.1 hypothetical protein [Mycolicibacterium neoaurum]